MIFVTTYRSPDIDGIACSIAYAELLGKSGKNVQTTYFGNLSREVEFVKKFTKSFPLKKHFGNYPDDANFILVDTADPDAIEPQISLEKVIEIFDHRELVFTGEFANAKLNIEKVGSCATLITEVFQKNKLLPSQSAAAYLYSAIISNTVNFKNTVTTQRDINAAEWLRPIAKIGDDYIKKMFEFKSKIGSWEDLKFIIDQDYATKILDGKKFMMAQVEIAKLKSIVKKYQSNIEGWLKEKKKRENIDYTLFTGIDILEGINILIVVDEESDRFFSRALGLKKIGEGCETKEIIMRKQIWPKVEEALKQ